MGLEYSPDLLEVDKHVAFRPTLTGLGERVHLTSPEVNLILFEELNNIILVGHSYGGMVITGVMDSIPDRISHVIFLDAAVPDDGMTALEVFGSLTNSMNEVDGHVQFPWIDLSQPYPRDVPQSLKTFTEAVSYDNPKAKELPVTYVAFVMPDQVEERKANDSSWIRAMERGWDIVILNSDHNAQRSHPEELVRIMEKAVY